MLNQIVRTIAWNWPLKNGSGMFIAKFCKDVDTGSGVVSCKTKEGIKLDVLGHDLIGRHLILSGRFDRSTIQVLIDFSSQGDQIIDIGANIGYYSCLLLHAVHGSNLLAIEPQPEISALAEKNLSAFPRHRWSLLACGLSDRHGEGKLQIDIDNRGASRLVEGVTGTVSVPLVPAADVLGALPKIDLIKMDIEGHEETVFRSALEVLENRQPRAILFEDQTGKAGPQGPIGQMLAGIGYRLFGVRKRIAGNTLEPITAANAGTFNDVLAVSKLRSIPEGTKRKYRLSL